MSDREQALGDGLPAAGVTPFAAAAPDTSRRAPQPAQDRPQHDRRDDDDARHQHEHRKRGLDAQRAPGQHEVAGLLGYPGRARGAERDQQQKQNDPDHRNPYCAGLASTAMASAPNWREAASAASRASTFSSHPCAAARSAGSSLFNSFRASLKSLRNAAAVIRATTAPRS